MNVLVNCPQLDRPGGVANHYLGLRRYWTANVKYNQVGARFGVPGPIMLIYDYAKFFILCASRKYKIVLLNPSLAKNALIRDYVFLRIASFFRLKAIVFIHGWNQDLANDYDLNPSSFYHKYRYADAFIVLSSSFRSALERWGIDSPVYLSSTKVDDSLLEGFSFGEKVPRKKILFLARVERDKGIFTTIQAFRYVKDKVPDASLVVAGTGSALGDASSMVRDLGLDNVRFTGQVSGSELREVFRQSDVYILPTEHGEGMPTSVLEAMAFGLPIISRPVGGLVDFFQQKRMGYLSNTTEPEWYADVLCMLLSDSDQALSIGAYNHAYAKEHFMASKVALMLEDIMRHV